MHRVVRTAGLYGPGGADFVGAIRGRLAAGLVRVVTDEFNSPTYVDDLAPALWRVILGDEPGTWHLTATGGVSRFDFARRIALLSGYDPALVQPTTHAELGRPARRPAYSVLDGQAAREVFGCTLPSWDSGIDRFLQSERSR
jgi:dTDP-4-dehydrorhamnose reductase